MPAWLQTRASADIVAGDCISAKQVQPKPNHTTALVPGIPSSSPTVVAILFFE
jgi:hypothetical protein